MGYEKFVIQVFIMMIVVTVAISAAMSINLDSLVRTDTILVDMKDVETLDLANIVSLCIEEDDHINTNTLDKMIIGGLREMVNYCKREGYDISRVVGAKISTLTFGTDRWDFGYNTVFEGKTTEVFVRIKDGGSGTVNVGKLYVQTEK
ncbi:MAG: hypothetical protein ABIH55_02255 [Nanoarchaeota archaeon]|nr:hypothetical protein [Nanoarchaeota archaeon]